ncbi:AAEL006280-PA [Aedes aegypti]|uniref:Juvenile hormone acid methyl transferase n=2 Tax=Aedes aegypti TaxID=7159 RepID=Q206L4_AEDAE|nr:juvenile hormone acid O-methyltransferase [Aedes aegypti]ABD65474.1 juvenile hormone acid methyl transferase [Aedes aegypti]EAT42177.1 AAEL006280-PA [Aedes aegypti]WES75118.1 juvenile hormone acid O-methyltransferase [Aedes aegypti]
MNKPNLYHRANGVQRRDAKEILDEHGHLLRWKEENEDSLLDIGCGSGDVLIDFVIPMVPPKRARVLGTDVSEQMVRFARKVHSDVENLFFETLDIEGDISSFLNKWGCFDHITSFYCLHWVRSQRSAFSNIYNLMAPNGDCLLGFLARNPIFDIYDQLSNSAKWSMYMTDVDKYISPYQYCENPVGEIEEILSSVGFTKYKIHIADKIYVYEGIDSLKKAVQAVNPFSERMPLDLQEDFLNDYIAVVRRMSLSENCCGNENDYKFITPYKLVVVYAVK